jgi:transposase-like protein
MRKKDVFTAIQDSGAVMSTIARRLSCDWHTAKRWCLKWEDTAQALEDETEKILDMAESKLYQSINEGNTQDAKWLLSTKGKRRGFTERTEITGAEGADLSIKVQWGKSEDD